MEFVDSNMRLRQKNELQRLRILSQYITNLNEEAREKKLANFKREISYFLTDVASR